MRVPFVLRSAPIVCCIPLAMLALSPPPDAAGGEQVGARRGLTVIAIGDAGETSGAQRGCGMYLTNMYTGQHDAGSFQVLIFLGNNFMPMGLNVPPGDVPGKVSTIADPFKVPLAGLGARNVHAIPGNHDYYARYAIEKSAFFGLFKTEEMPIGLTGRGNDREAALDFWSYHAGLPAEATYPLGENSPDSVQFLFFDTALPLRTPSSLWAPALDSLRHILQADHARPGIVWHLLCTHHPFATVGVHGGYSLWDEETNDAAYVTPCDRDSNALAWFKNLLDPEDVCADRYRQLVDSLKQIINASGIMIQAAIAGHDGSMQFLLTGEDGVRQPFPSLQIVSGAGSVPTMVRSPRPPRIYTSAEHDPLKKGESAPGFAQIFLAADRMRVVFYNADNGDRIDMGDGKKEFWIDRDGRLIP